MNCKKIYLIIGIHILWLFVCWDSVIKCATMNYTEIHNFFLGPTFNLIIAPIICVLFEYLIYKVKPYTDKTQNEKYIKFCSYITISLYVIFFILYYSAYIDV